MTFLILKYKNDLKSFNLTNILSIFDDFFNLAKFEIFDIFDHE